MHISVLKKEVIQYLNPKPNENFIDATVDGGGHALAILEKIGPQGKILGIDRDREQIEKLKILLREKRKIIKDLEKRFILIWENFAHLKRIIQRERFDKIDGILFDLGMSRWHLEKSKRGFSFKRDEPLIMRYDWEKDDLKSSKKLTADKIVNQRSKKEIERILREYGEEKFFKRIAREIIKTRKIKPIKTTFQLVEVIRKAVPLKYQNKRIHFATRTFQALRIVVNNELEDLKNGLNQALEVLKPTGRIVVISFHSLEDRIVKNFFREKAKRNLLKILTKKPIRPSFFEIKTNPSSRSAKLRAVIKI